MHARSRTHNGPASYTHPRAPAVPGVSPTRPHASAAGRAAKSSAEVELGEGGWSGGRSEQQMTNEQRMMNNDLGCWGRTGGSHRRTGRAQYEARQGGVFFLAVCCCASWWTTERRKVSRFSHRCVFTCKQELHMLRLVPTSQRVGPPSTQSQSGSYSTCKAKWRKTKQ